MSNRSSRVREGQGVAVLVLALQALGVVFGDIGTNILFALRAAFEGPYSVPLTPANVLGVLSLFFWALLLIVSVKYLTFVMRADNRGEGGIMALLALLSPGRGLPGVKHRNLFITVGLVGAALLYGDGVVTPAISVLAAVEGLEIASPVLHRVVVPITVVILVSLFLVQRHGTGRIGGVFGPIMLVWFISIALLGLRGISRHPQILSAANPLHAVSFFVDNGIAGFFVLGVVVLTIAGAEAMYADMGHFGARPIRLAWYCVGLPALFLNYFGQGAILVTDTAAVEHPFYYLVPGWAHYPVVLLATMATIIASQALISGAFSLTRQAIQLGYLPRMKIAYTSARIPGRVYIPEVNWVLMLLCVALVLEFRQSARLAAAYGTAVIGTMIATSFLFFAVTRARWGWGLLRAALIAGLFLLVDLVLLGANLVKLLHGAWFPVAVGVLLYTLMSTWRRGRDALGRQLRARAQNVKEFLRDLKLHQPARVPGTGIFMTPIPEVVPPSLHHSLDRLNILYQQVVLFSIVTKDIPMVPDAERVEVEQITENVWQVTAYYGFMQTPDVPEILRCCIDQEMKRRMQGATYFLGLVTLFTTGKTKMATWRKRLFAFLWRNARPARVAFRIPPEQVVELGVEIQI